MMIDHKTNKKSMSVDDMIALTNSFLKFGEFDRNIKEYMSKSKRHVDMYNLIEACSGHKIVVAKRAKEFYKNNKDIVEAINTYSSFNKFIYENYDKNGDIRDSSCIKEFYQHLMKNRNQVVATTVLLEEIKKMGFERVIFDEGNDFSNEKYSVNINFTDNIDIVYLENMEPIYNYEKDKIEYKTKGSNYRIVLTHRYSGANNKPNLENRYIAVNNFSFGVSRLPKKISREETFDKILELREKNEDNYTRIQDSIDISVMVDDLCSLFNKTNIIVEQLRSVKTKEQLKTIMLRIKENIDVLHLISDNYDNSIVNSNTGITKEQIQKEKKKYIINRFNSDIDLD